ncbi:MAG: hypothetical protein HYZ28_27605 [Myxococcales bacterium]|nr:hypothetical protein [Myxococcales bacterium]
MGRWEAGWSGVSLLSAVLLGFSARAEGDGAEGEPRVSASGRLFVRALGDERRSFERELSVSSARLGLKAKLRYAEAEVSVDLASKAMVKDAFLGLQDRKKRLRLYGGQFKAPFLSRQRISAWDLPLISRGLLEDYLVDRHQLGGRRLGLMAELNPPGPASAQLAVLDGPRDELGSRQGEDLAARARLGLLRGLALGASGYFSGPLGGGGGRKFAAAVDADLERGGLSLFGEASLGRLPVGSFAAGALLAAYRLPLDSAGKWQLEPLLAGELLQLLSPSRGRGFSATAGANLLYAKRVRVQLQAERAFDPGDERPAMRLALQLGARL